MWEINQRNHAKLLIIDGTTYVAGGRNIADEYFGLSDRINFSDADLVVSGPSVNQAAQAFNDLWVSPNSAKIRPNSGPFVGWENFCSDGETPHRGGARFRKCQRCGLVRLGTGTRMRGCECVRRPRGFRKSAPGKSRCK